MTMIADVYKVDSERVAQALAEARENLNSTESEVTLDFSGVRRIDREGLGAMEDIAAAADCAKSVKIVLRGVNVDVYKVLKLAKVAPTHHDSELALVPEPPHSFARLRTAWKHEPGDRSRRLISSLGLTCWLATVRSWRSVRLGCCMRRKLLVAHWSRGFT